MDNFSLLLIGIGLSIDSLAASITIGACSEEINRFKALKVAAFMAVFQGGMPLFGYLVGSSFKHLIQSIDHWVAFVLLLGIGLKLIYDALSKDDKQSIVNTGNHLLLMGVALATSIDAAIMGVGFALIEVNIWKAMLIIGICTFLFAFVGVYTGKQLGTKINSGIEVFGGLVLITLGVKILIEHTYL